MIAKGPAAGRESPLEVQWRCLKCLRRNLARPDPPGQGPWSCVHCGEQAAAHPEALGLEGRIVACPVCGCPDLYRQRDFNRRLGVAIMILAAVGAFTLGAFFGMGLTYALLVAFALLDLVIYRALSDIAVCYHCRAIARRYPGIDQVPPFDLNISDKYIAIERKRGW